VSGLLKVGLLRPGPPARGTDWMLTLLAVCAVATDARMPSPLARRPLKLSATSPSSSSCMGLGALLRSTAVASLWSLAKPGRVAGGLVGGDMCVNPRGRALSSKRRPGVLVALSGMPDVSCISGRRSAIAPTQGEKPCPPPAAWNYLKKKRFSLSRRWVSRNGCGRVTVRFLCTERASAAARLKYQTRRFTARHVD
jgi:hypothetical protein